MNTLMRHVIAATFALATSLMVAAIFAAMGWGDGRWFEGAFAALVYRDMLDAPWVRRNVDEWWPK